MRNRDASFIYIMLSAAQSLFYAIFLPVELVYLIEVAGFNPLQIVLVGTLRQAMNFLFQVPSGILSDIYSRRVAVILGILLIGAGYLIEGLSSTLTIIFAAQVFIGLGNTLMTGADTAWIADEVGSERVGPLYIRAAQVSALISLPGIALSALLVNISLHLPLVLSGSLLIGLSILLVFVMPERHFIPIHRENRNILQQMEYTFRASIQLVRQRPVLLTVLGVALCAGVFSASFNQLWNYYLLHSFVFPAVGGLTSVTWFSVIEVGIVITNFCGISIVNRCVDTHSHRAVIHALFVVDSLSAISVIGFAMAGQFALALLLFFLFTTVSGPGLSLGQVWLNQHLESSVRATVFSLREQVNAIAQISGGPLLGLLATQVDTRTALVVAGIILCPPLLLYARVQFV